MWHGTSPQRELVRSRIAGPLSLSLPCRRKQKRGTYEETDSPHRRGTRCRGRGAGSGARRLRRDTWYRHTEQDPRARDRRRHGYRQAAASQGADVRRRRDSRAGLHRSARREGPRAEAASKSPGGAPSLSQADTQGCQNVFHAAGAPDNVRVNQDCSLRRQAEEVVVVNPTNPNEPDRRAERLPRRLQPVRLRLVLRRRQDLGRPAAALLPVRPVGDGHTADACSDPTATFDSKGNAYVGGVFFRDHLARQRRSSWRSRTRTIGGAFYHTPPSCSVPGVPRQPARGRGQRQRPEHRQRQGVHRRRRHREQPEGEQRLRDLDAVNADTGAGVGGNSPIYFSQSTDGGATWSPGIEISGASPPVCTRSAARPTPNACDQDQGSHPIVGPDGTVYVAFGNGNTPQRRDQPAPDRLVPGFGGLQQGGQLDRRR